LVAAGVLLAVLLLELGMRGAGWMFERSRRQRMERQLAAAGELRILCLGESMTEGDPWHLRYPEALQHILDWQLLDCEVTVINGVVGGIRTDGILADLERNLDRYRPQIVVSMMGINDRGKTHAYGTIIAPGEGRWYGSLRVYKLYRVLRAGLERRLGLHPASELVVADDVPPPRPEPQTDSVGRAIRQGSQDSVDQRIVDVSAMARDLRDEGRFDEAEALLQQLVLERPDSVAPTVELYLHLTEAGEYRRAHQLLVERQRSLPQPSAAILEALAGSHRNLEQWDESIATLLTLRLDYTAADDYDLHAHCAAALAEAYEAAGRLEEAESCLLEICERLQPGDPVALDLLIDFYDRHGRDRDAARYRELQWRIRHEYVNPMTSNNYSRLVEELDTRGIVHLAAQYPMRRIESLHRLLGRDPRPLYVDLHFIAELVERDGYETYFIDSFAGDFGHMTDLGNVLAAAVIAALGKVGVQSTSLVAILGAAGLAVGFALQGSLSNFAAGVMMLVFRPIDIGQRVTVAGHTGGVQEIGLFATTLRTPDNETIIIPNSMITADAIINYAMRGNVRANVSIGVAYGTDLAKAMDVIQKACAASDLVLDDPAPDVAFAGFGASSLDLLARPWSLPDDFPSMQHNVRINIYNALEEAGIEIPFDQIVVHQAE
jgi:small conductance mechanosensitive channel